MVEECAQRLLCLMLVESGPQGQQVPAGDVRSEGDRQPVVGLPRVDRHEVEVSRILPCRPNSRIEQLPFAVAESLAEVTGLVKPHTQREVAMVALSRHPSETIERSVLGRQLAELGKSESNAT